MAILLTGECAAYPSPGRTWKPVGEFYDIIAPMDTGLAGTADDYVERARRLAPQIEACADQIEQERRLAGPVLDALFEAGRLLPLPPPPAAPGQGCPPASPPRHSGQ